jgi:hypothetical protein
MRLPWRASQLGFVGLSGLVACGPTWTADAAVVPAGPVDAEVALRAAVVLASCTTEMPTEYTLSRLERRVYPAGSPWETSRLAECIDGHRGGCEAIVDCLAMTVDRNTPSTTRCDGNVADTSLGNDRVRVDCARLGKSCVVIGAIAECIDTSTATCEPDAAASCTADARAMQCRAGHAQYGVSCRSLGLSCGGDGTSMYCAASGRACSSADLSADYVSYDGERCAEGSLVGCVGGQEAMVDCTTLVRGASCWPAGDGSPEKAYCGFGDQCAPDRPPSAACDGDSVVVCNGGRVERVDCRALGFAGCESGLRSALGDRYAACAM